MSDIGGNWHPWMTRDIPSARNEKAFDAMLEQAFVPPQGPSLALAGSDRGAPDYEACILQAFQVADALDIDDDQLRLHAIANTQGWRNIVDAIVNRVEDGTAREALEHTRKSWRKNLS